MLGLYRISFDMSFEKINEKQTSQFDYRRLNKSYKIVNNLEGIHWYLNDFLLRKQINVLLINPVNK
jgi:hypothetical protein